MGSVWKTILGVLLAVIIVVAGSSMLEANNNAVLAENYLHKAVAEYSASNFNAKVLNSLTKEAAQMGYELKETQNVKDSWGYTSYAILELRYSYEISAIGLSQTHGKSAIVY